MTTLIDIERQARGLSSADRARLAEVMLESLHEAPLAGIEAAWRDEIEARIAAYDRGELHAQDAEDVFAEASRRAR